MTMLKLKDYQVGEYLAIWEMGDAQRQRLEVELIEKLKAEGILPLETFTVRVKVEVDITVRATAEQLKSGPFFQIGTLRQEEMIQGQAELTPRDLEVLTQEDNTLLPSLHQEWAKMMPVVDQPGEPRGS